MWLRVAKVPSWSTYHSDDTNALVVPCCPECHAAADSPTHSFYKKDEKYNREEIIGNKEEERERRGGEIPRREGHRHQLKCSSAQR